MSTGSWLAQTRRGNSGCTASRPASRDLSTMTFSRRSGESPVCRGWKYPGFVTDHYCPVFVSEYRVLLLGFMDFCIFILFTVTILCYCTNSCNHKFLPCANNYGTAIINYYKLPFEPCIALLLILLLAGTSTLNIMIICTNANYN